MKKTLAQIIGNLDYIYFVDKLKDSKVLADYYKYYYNDLSKEAALKGAKTYLKSIDLLFNPEIDNIVKKYLLVMLAFLPSPQAYRALEKYAQAPDPGLEDWAYLSLLENRALLESKLLGEPRYVVSSPLGGKNKKIRLFIAFKTKDNIEFTHWQSQLVEKEINFYFDSNGVELELLDIREFYVRLVALFPLNVDFEQLIIDIIEKINEIGDFIDKKGIINNERIFSPEKTKEALETAPNLGEKNFIGIMNSSQIKDDLDKIQHMFDVDDTFFNDSDDFDEPNNDDNDNQDETTNTDE